MTAKEKAIELFDRFYEIEPVEPIYVGVNIRQAKQCALICVDEMIDLANTYENKHLGDIQQLQEVKQEINKL